jgi:hypothetical protein
MAAPMIIRITTIAIPVPKTYVSVIDAGGAAVVLPLDVVPRL